VFCKNGCVKKKKVVFLCVRKIDGKFASTDVDVLRVKRSPLLRHAKSRFEN